MSGRDFVAGPLRRLLVRTETAGGFSIGTHTIRLRSEDGCYDREITTDANGIFSDDLPPLKYTAQVTATALKSGTGLDQIEVDRYFTGLGAQPIDLTEKSDTLAMAYHAPLKIAVLGLPDVCEAELRGARQARRADARAGAALPARLHRERGLRRARLLPGAGRPLRIYDEIADDTETPVDTTVAYGTIAYQTAVGQPNVLSGRTVDGVDRSYQKSLQIIATVRHAHRDPHRLGGRDGHQGPQRLLRLVHDEPGAALRAPRPAGRRLVQLPRKGHRLLLHPRRLVDVEQPRHGEQFPEPASASTTCC